MTEISDQGQQSIYITTTLPYVNARPHIGHALEFVQADVYARVKRLQGCEVFFNTGTDEHGQKIKQKATDSNHDPKTYVDHYATEFQTLLKQFNISNDAFIRTTSDNHMLAAQAMWERCNEASDIYKKQFTGLYCVGCELFLTERDLVDGNCPDHNQPPQEIMTENYFFKFSNYSQPLLDLLSDPNTIIPDHHRQWAINFVREGLDDFSISRRRDQLDWGIPVPGDDDHVMYVWFDALTNYISTLGWPSAESDGLFEEFWNNGHTIQFAGKDQVRMQSLMWQAMLMSAGEQPTTQIFYHGFITSEGQKMSKSIGNVIDPFEIINDYGTDFLRTFLLRHIHPVDDSDVTKDKLANAYNADFVNGIGNLVSRILTMAENYDVEYGVQDIDDVLNSEDADQFFNLISEFAFNEALDWLWAEFAALDEYIASEEPFKTIKTNEVKAKADVAYCAIRLHELAVLLQVITPDTADKITSAIEKRTKPDNLFPRK